jgi:hypothetical protein
VHEVDHPVGEPAQVLVELLDLVRPQTQGGIGVLADLSEREPGRASCSGSRSSSTISPSTLATAAV